MIPPDARLFIYEAQGEAPADIPSPPESYIGLWNEDDLYYLFFLDAQDEYAERVITTAGGKLTSRHALTYAEWQEGMPPEGLTVGRLRFTPADRDVPPGALALDPSVVFGDGSHPTTVHCLRQMQKALRSCRVQSLLDLGTGTGILALGAAALGISHILAVDMNRLAVAVTRRNVELNRLSHCIRVQEGSARWFVGRPYDMVAANLPFQALRDLCSTPEITRHRCLIVSGVSEYQGNALLDLLRERKYELRRYTEHSPWVTFTVMNTEPRSVRTNRRTR